MEEQEINLQHHISDALHNLVPFASACNFSKINTPPWVFFMFFKLYKWYQIAQRTTFVNPFCPDFQMIQKPNELIYRTIN